MNSNSTYREMSLNDYIFDGCRLIDLPVLGDDRGSLVALEALRPLPFDLARIYYIFATKPGVSRGFHAHRNLKQWAICVAGACTILVDNGCERVEIKLHRPDQALEIGSLVWREMHDFSSDCVLMVLADSIYDENDYIRDQAEFHDAVHAASR